MEAVQKEIRALGVETRIVQADFTGNANFEFYKDIVQQTEGIDISLVVLNAGCGSSGPIM